MQSHSDQHPETSNMTRLPKILCLISSTLCHFLGFISRLQGKCKCLNSFEKFVEVEVLHALQLSGTPFKFFFFFDLCSAFTTSRDK